MICLMGASKPRVWWKLVYLVPVVARPCTRSSEPRPGQSRKESPFDPTEATASHLARAAPQRIDLYCTPRSQVMHQTRQVGPLTFTLPDGHLQGVQGQVGVQACGGLPADDPPRVHVGDEGAVDPPGEGAYIGGGTSRLRGMSATHSPPGANASKWRLTRSAVHCSRGALRVVRGDLARLTPRRPGRP